MATRTKKERTVWVVLWTSDMDIVTIPHERCIPLKVFHSYAKAKADCERRAKKQMSSDPNLFEGEPVWWDEENLELKVKDSPYYSHWIIKECPMEA